MKYALGNMLNGAGGLNPDGLAIDLQFAADKTLTARRGPTPVFSRGSSGTFVNANGLIVGKTAGTTASITPSTQAIGSQVTVTVASGSVVGWVVGQAVSLIVDTDGQDDPDATELWLLGNIVSTTATQLVFEVTQRTGQSGSATSWTLGYRGPRFDHDPVTLASRGLLIEESRTNLVFPSDTLTTQTRTVTAVAHTLSFYGTGTVVLSGAHSATVVGTGAYPTRTTLTFTPTAGSLTLTVTGSVTQAQIEAGSFPTSYIPTTTASVVRSADVCSITGAAFNSFYNQSEGTLFADISGLMNATLGGARPFVGISDGTYQNQILILKAPSSGFLNASGTVGNLSQFNFGNVYSPSTQYKVALGFKTNDANAAFNGSLGTTDTSVTMPTTMNRLELRDSTGSAGGQPSGHIAAIRYYKKRLPNAKLQALTV